MKATNFLIFSSPNLSSAGCPCVSPIVIDQLRVSTEELILIIRDVTFGGCGVWMLPKLLLLLLFKLHGTMNQYEKLSKIRHGTKENKCMY